MMYIKKFLSTLLYVAHNIVSSPVHMLISPCNHKIAPLTYIKHRAAVDGVMVAVYHYVHIIVRVSLAEVCIL